MAGGIILLTALAHFSRALGSFHRDPRQTATSSSGASQNPERHGAASGRAMHGTAARRQRSLILIEGDEISLRSTAVLKIARRMTRAVAVGLSVSAGPATDSRCRVSRGGGDSLTGLPASRTRARCRQPEIRARLIYLGLLNLLQQQKTVTLVASSSQ